MMINLDLNRRAVLTISFFFILLVLMTLGYTLWQWKNDWKLAHQQNTGVPRIAMTNDTAALITALPDHHLFGQSFSNGSVPITSLQLRVTGIVKLEQEINGALSKAFISISGQPGKIFRVGDKLPYGVKVYDITPLAVILENEGHLEKLPLSREKLQFKQRTIQE
jgi:hypothetical protein